jgi:hypothetical protein
MTSPDAGRRGPPPARSRRCAIIDEVPGLGSDLAPGARPVARRAAAAQVVVLEVGEQPVGDWWSRSLHGPGLLIVHGVIAKEVHVAGRTATELLGPGDLLRPWDVEEDPVPVDVVWRVIAETELAVLDAFFADRVRPWPALTADLMARAVQRAEGLAVQRAIASHPRVDMRVSMLLWHLAGRWGKVQADGTVRLDVPLTHRLVGELIGAERPSVSHAFGRLQRAGLVLRAVDGWHLVGSPAQHAEAASRPRPAALSVEVIENTPEVALQRSAR